MKRRSKFHFDDRPAIFTVAEAARYVQIQEPTLRRAIARKAPPPRPPPEELSKMFRTLPATRSV